MKSSVINVHFLGSLKLQRILNIFVFLLAFPAVEVLGNSLYFYLFLYLLWKTYKRVGYSVETSKFTLLLLISWIFGVISTAFHPPLEAGDYSSMRTVTMTIRYAYWFTIGAFFYTWIKKMDLLQISKWITFGYLCQVVGFYLLPLDVDVGLISFNASLTRNSFVFNSIIFSGFLYFYIISRYGKNLSLWVSIFILLNLLLTNGRAGAIVGLLIVIVNSAVLTPALRSFAKMSVIVAILLSLSGVLNESNLNRFGLIIAPIAESLNPRFGSLLRGEGEGNLDFDKSWLIRELMIDKTIEILGKFPFLGIGYSHFTNYEAELDELSDPKYARLRNHSIEYYNTRTPHNSYANHFVESGIIGGVILIVLIFPIIWWFGVQFWQGNLFLNSLYIVIITGFIGSIIHAYGIAAFTGANFWFMLGTCSQLVRKLNM